MFYSVEDFPIGGKAEVKVSDPFTRIDTVQAANLPNRVQELARNTAGLFLDFESDATDLHLQWVLDEYRILWNMTPVAVNGFDLYGWTGSQWQYMASAKPSGTENSVKLIGNMKGNLSQYRLYFPLYSGLRQLKLGMEASAEIRPSQGLPEPCAKVVIYGSSITQGASASRPGMAFPSIIARELTLEMLNFGFSGSGKLDLEMAAILGGIDSDLIILDCVPNPSVEEIQQRTLPFVQRLRELRPDTPILMIESIFRENGHWDQKVHEKVSRQNQAYRDAYEQLLKAGTEELYYLSSENLIGTDHEATTDGIHLSDLGHYRMAGELSGVIQEILKIDATGTGSRKTSLKIQKTKP